MDTGVDHGLDITTHRVDGAVFAQARIIGRTPLNVLDDAALDAVLEGLGELHTRCFRPDPVTVDPDALRGIVLGGTDRAFVGGADLKRLGALDPGSARAFITRVHRVCAAVRALPVPVIGRVHGYCLGAGMEIAAACDFRVGDDTAVVGMPEVQVGVPSVVEAVLLPRIIGWGRTRELLLLGHTLEAADAARIGFLERLVPAAALDSEIDRCLALLASAGARAVALQKQLIDRWEDASIATGVAAGVDAFARAFESDEPAQLTDAFFRARQAAKAAAEGDADR